MVIISVVFWVSHATEEYFGTRLQAHSQRQVKVQLHILQNVMPSSKFTLGADGGDHTRVKRSLRTRRQVEMMTPMDLPPLEMLPPSLPYGPIGGSDGRLGGYPMPVPGRAMGMGPIEMMPNHQVETLFDHMPFQDFFQQPTQMRSTRNKVS